MGGIKLISILICLAGMALGLYAFLAAARVIEMQRRFYEKINWRMEPISMPKEIGNTKMMGMFLFAVSVIALGFVLVMK